MTEFNYCAYPALKRVFCERQSTCGQIADAVGISRSNVWFWLSGKNQRTIDVIKAFLAESGLTFEEAFGGEMIKDSGERTKFSSGAVRDMHGGKGRMDLLPWAAIMEISKHCEAGALKYGEHNVDRGIPTHSLLDSAMRHAAKYLDGWTDEPHLAAAAWNLLWAVQMELKNPECVDTPWKNEF